MADYTPPVQGDRPERKEPPNITIRRPFFRRRKASPFAHADAPGNRL